MLIDTHAHLNFQAFRDDIKAVVRRAQDEDIQKIINVGADLDSSQKAVAIAQKYDGLYASIGIHPHHAENYGDLADTIKKLEKLAQNPKVVAIGECGLDYSPAPAGEKERTKERQFSLFQKQIEIALKHNLPLIIHSRKAFNDTYQILKEYFHLSNKPNGVFHCYSGGKKDIKNVEGLGFYFGIDGNLTYDLGLQNVAKEIPLEQIILETDSPFLAPEPFRGLRNEPANVKIIAEFLAKIKGVSFEKICQITTQNAQALFAQTR